MLSGIYLQYQYQNSHSALGFGRVYIPSLASSVNKTSARTDKKSSGNDQRTRPAEDLYRRLIEPTNWAIVVIIYYAGEMGNLLGSPGSDVGHIRPLQNVLNAAARLILRKRKYDRITAAIRDLLHWLPVQQ